MTTPLAPAAPNESRIPSRRSRLLGALEYRDFRLLWLCGLLTNVGYWMQFTSLTYLVAIVLSHSAAQSSLNLGLLGAARTLPVLIAAPIAGYVADRYPRRLTLTVTNLILAALALGLAFVSQGHGPWVLPATLAIAGLFSGIQCFDFPTRQSWVTLIVPRHLIANAIGLASFANNMPLIFGPALSGILISTAGVYPSLYFAAAAQCSVLIALIFVRPAPRTNPSREPMLRQIAGGVQFIATDPLLRWLVFMLGVSCFFLRPYIFLLAAFAGHVLDQSAGGYGLMLGVGGVGSVIGALTTALNRSERRSGLWLASALALAGGMVAVAFTRSFPVVLALLFVMGWGTMAFNSTTNVLVQTLAPEAMRGRVMSFYTLIMSGVVPAGTLMLGAMGAQFGLPWAYLFGGVTALLATAWVWTTRPALRAV